MNTKHAAFDFAEHLDTEEKIVNYLDDCLEEGGVELFQKALGDVARARGMSAIADEAGISRPGLYKALSEGGNPALGTISKVLNSFGLRLSVQPLHHT